MYRSKYVYVLVSQLRARYRASPSRALPTRVLLLVCVLTNIYCAFFIFVTFALSPKKQDGDHGSGAALRDYNDFVITERWRGIERSYDGNMAILPVWRAWSRVHNEVICDKPTLHPSPPCAQASYPGHMPCKN